MRPGNFIFLETTMFIATDVPGRRRTVPSSWEGVCQRDFPDMRFYVRRRLNGDFVDMYAFVQYDRRFHVPAFGHVSMYGRVCLDAEARYNIRLGVDPIDVFWMTRESWREGRSFASYRFPLIAILGSSDVIIVAAIVTLTTMAGALVSLSVGQLLAQFLHGA